jgi:hypothetical protein
MIAERERATVSNLILFMALLFYGVDIFG